MGVRRLQTFLEEHCPEACHEVRIADLANAYRHSTGRDPVIVVDGASCTSHIYGDLDWVCGGQCKEYEAKIRHFVHKFNELGIKLVVFFDGVAQPARRSLWVQRRYQSMEQVLEVFDMIKSGKSVKNIPESLFSLPVGLSQILSYVLMETCEVRNSLGESDVEIAKYAEENDCFAILGQDTDYVIYKGAHYYLSVQKLNLVTMKTLLYSRDALARVLNFPLEQLPIFATLMGNDVVHADKLKAFHRMLTGPVRGEPYARVLVHRVSEFIRTLPIGNDLMRLLPDLGAKIFGTRESAQILKQSILSYDISEQNEEGNTQNDAGVSESWDELVALARQYHIRAKTPKQVYAVIHESVFDISTALEDYRLDFPSSATVLKPIRERMYGVLLQEKPTNAMNSSLTVEEWCMSGPHSLDRATVVPAIKPKVQSPSLKFLWTNSSADLQPIKLELFAWILRIPVPSQALLNLPPHIIAVTLILFYLFHYRYTKAKILHDWEVCAFASATVDQQAMSVRELAHLEVDEVDGRGIQLSTIFMRALHLLTIVNAICGEPFHPKLFYHYNVFDGKLFQRAYLDAKKKRICIQISPLRGSLEHYNQVCSAVLNC